MDDTYAMQVPNWFDNSWNANTGGTAVDLGGISQSGGASGDPWGGFFRETVGTVIGYAINRDAARVGIQTPQASPTYIATQAQQQQNLMPLLLIVGAVVAVVALNK